MFMLFACDCNYSVAKKLVLFHVYRTSLDRGHLSVGWTDHSIGLDFPCLEIF